MSLTYVPGPLDDDDDEAGVAAAVCKIACCFGAPSADSSSQDCPKGPGTKRRTKLQHHVPKPEQVRTDLPGHASPLADGDEDSPTDPKGPCTRIVYT